MPCDAAEAPFPNLTAPAAISTLGNDSPFILTEKPIRVSLVIPFENSTPDPIVYPFWFVTVCVSTFMAPDL
jgi:hypothetical protein